jgi:hypothetical protein
MLGFSNIAWALSQLTNGGVKENFVWATSQHKSFEELKFHLFSPPVLILPYLQQPFEIETNDLDYDIGVVINLHGNLVAYYSEILYYVVRRYLQQIDVLHYAGISIVEALHSQKGNDHPH